MFYATRRSRADLSGAKLTDARLSGAKLASVAA
ncbi:pentapeptide repeat-containing protein [Sorangium cellulosum]